jgi:hypothetical protein
MNVRSATIKTTSRIRNRVLVLPAVAAMVYPFVLQAFHRVVSSPGFADSVAGVGSAAILLIVAFVLPLSGLVFAFKLTRDLQQSSVAACRLAYASAAAPPLFVFLGVTRGLLRIQIPELALWIGLWALAGLYVCWVGGTPTPRQKDPPPGAWRVAHGISAALITCFVLFHLINHLFGLLGPDTHAAIMKAGRTIYRATLIEPLLVILLLFQVASGARLAWRWSGLGGDAYRVFQVGSGAYLAAYILTHLNSALISARAVHKIDTDWAWASGAPIGLIHDAWDIRLLPHYALGVFFIVGHLFSGLRIVMLAHNTRAAVANRIWAAGLSAGALLSAAISCGLCGARI